MKNTMLLALTFLIGSFLPLKAQNTISGKVVDDKNQALPGVNILIKGTMKGTITDPDGNYSLEALPGDTLIFSMVSMKTREIPVSGKSIIDVQLKPNIEQLEAAVVIGYGTSRAKDLTAPITTVKSDEISRQATANPAQALQGQVAGVTVTNNGEPGSEPQIRVRGVSTIYGEGNGPLYVVDGVIVNNINFLSNNDIESMTILKDASASAIYGVRAANGVILVTTKKGISNKPQVSFSTYTGLQHPTNILKMANTTQYIGLLNERIGLTGAGTPFDPASYPVSTDWYKELIRNPLVTSSDLSVSGGTEKYTYSYGVNYFYQNGLINSSYTNNNYNRINLRARNDYKFSKYISAGYNLLFSRSRNTPGYNYAFYQAYVSPPAFSPKNSDGSWGDPTGLGFSGSFANPVASINTFNKQVDEYNIVPSTYLTINFLRDFTFKTVLSSNIDYSITRDYVPLFYVSGLQNNSTTSLTKNYSFNRSLVLDNTLQFSKDFNKHHIRWMVGNSVQSYFDNYLEGKSYNIPDLSNATLYLNLGSENLSSATDGGNRSNVLSYFSRLNYSYASKYLLNLTLRADGSSKYNKHWGIFPSIGAGWVISQEDFMKNQNVINFLKLRASWGKLGNNNIPANSQVIVGTSGPNTTGIFGGNNAVPGLTFSTVYNNFLKWETIEEYDAGAELYTLESRLNVELDYYNRITHNAVFNAPVAGVSGTDQLLGNNGKIQNQGVELTLGWSDKTSDGKLNYAVSGNFSTNVNKVLAINNESGIIYGPTLNGAFVTKTVKGEPIGSFYGYKVIGIFQSNADIESYTGSDQTVLQPGALPGDFKYANTNGDNKIDANDRQLLGSPIPKITYGLNGSLNYGNWDLAISFQGVAGNKIFNAKRANRQPFPDANYDLDFYKNHWTGSGSGNTYPSAALNRQNLDPNSFFVESGAYFRIRNVQLGYTLSPSLTNKWKIHKLRIYLSAQNPLTLFAYNGYTPEVGGDTPISTGIDYDTYPLSATYTGGLELNF